MNKTTKRICITFACLTAVFFIGTAVDNARASSSAEGICSSIHVGMTKGQLSGLVSEKKGWLRFSDAESARAGSTGWGLMCRCRIGLKQDIVIGVGKSVCID